MKQTVVSKFINLVYWSIDEYISFAMFLIIWKFHKKSLFNVVHVCKQYI